MIRIALFALIASGAALPCAAQYPDRPVTMLAGFPPGGLVDIVARVDQMSEAARRRYSAALRLPPIAFHAENPPAM